MQEFINDASFFLLQYLDLHSFLIPLGVIGMWRWGVWLFKKVVALRYRPLNNLYWSNVAVITPVYNEDPQIFTRALYSWKMNRPSEIIAVIDYTDKPCIEVFREFQKTFSRARLIITNIAGKRPALASGIRAAKAEIVALVDSDTLWAKDVLINGLSPFKDRQVAGVATYQNVLEPKTLAQKIFDLQLDLRYCDDFAFLAAAGNALICLSGRTAFYRREIILPLLYDLVNETFLGKPVISGDDKRLTYLVLAKGWKLAYQNNARVYTPGMTSLSAYLKQRLRWSRNALRADIRAMAEGWTWRYPALAFFQIDKVLQTFAVILSPIYFVISLLMGLWVPALIIFTWWLISRTIKMLPHLKRRPQDIVILPSFIAYSFLTAIIKLYAFYTLNTQGWITRWDSSRLPKLKFLQKIPAYLATLVTIFALAGGVFFYQQQTYFLPFAQRQQFISNVLVNEPNQESTPQSLSVGLTIADNSLLVTRYVVTPGDSLSSIAEKFSIEPTNLLAANISRLPNWNNLEPGTVLSIPGKDTHITPPANFNYQRIYADPQRITFNPQTNTIEVFGRGQTVTLAEISTQVEEERLKETSPGEWLLQSNIFLHSGTTLELDKNEVKWLKLKSDQEGYVNVLAYNAVLFTNGVKITSWDKQKNDVDNNLNDGRSFILAKDGSRMDLYDSEFAYLGFPRTPKLTVSPYGVSWRMSNGKIGTTLLTGEVINSNFHHNYFGAYTFGATGITWRGNRFYDNIRYGLDLHDDSNGFLVEKNLVYNNGSHGIIFSKRCINNIIRDNQSYNNKLHGIMLHANSDHNLIENNTLWGNHDGIALWNSKNNLVRDNKIYNNQRGIRANVTSNSNLLQGNTITGTKQYGIYLYNQATDNIIRENKLVNNTNAIYIKSPDNLIENNMIQQNQIGIYLTGEAQGNRIWANQVNYSSKYGIYAKTLSPQPNFLKDNQLKRNRKNVFAKSADIPAATPTQGVKTTAATFYINPYGQDSNDGRTISTPFRTIQKAVDLAQPGEIISLATGVYLQDVVTKRNGQENSPIVINGPPGAVIKGGGKDRVFEVDHDYIVLDGFTIDGQFGPADSIKGYRDKLLYIQGKEIRAGVTGLKVLNMTIQNSGGECIRLRYFAQNNEIFNNTIKNCGVYDFRFNRGNKNGEGIYIGTAPEQQKDGKNPTSDPDQSSGNLIHNNNIDTKGNECVDIKEASSGNIVENNKCTGQKDPKSGGLDARGGGNTLRHNEIFGNIGSGVRLGGDTLLDGINNNVYDNVIKDNRSGGIKFQRVGQGKICGNNMSGNNNGNAVGTFGKLFKPTSTCTN